MRAWLAFSFLMVSVLGCAESSGGPNGTADMGAPCTVAAHCDDAVYCNGPEQCVEGACLAGVAPCVGGVCVELSARCESTCVDADFDGYRDVACGGNDCDDGDENRFPGNVEVCDVDHHDEDCDPRTFGFRDQDMDGYPDSGCCNGDTCGSDCDDLLPSVHPSEAESCDDLDNDCDGEVDEGVLRQFYPDTDNDLAGDMSAAAVPSCDPVAEHVENALDCDDDSAAVGPLRLEVCDAGCQPNGTGCVDENCDGEVQTTCSCTGSQTRPCPAQGICAGGIETCNAASGLWGACSVTPSQEVCNGTDDNCNGMTDEMLAGGTCWVDADGDTYAASDAASMDVCGGCPGGYTNRRPIAGAADCNDNPNNGADEFPGATEVCDRRDNNCSSGGGVDAAEDSDNDDHTAIGYVGCTGGYPKDDCHDGIDLVHPGAAPRPGMYYCPPNLPPGSYMCAPGFCGPPSNCTMPAQADWDCSVP